MKSAARKKKPAKASKPGSLTLVPLPPSVVGHETSHHDDRPEDARAPLTDHLEELRGLIIQGLVATSVALAGTYTYGDFFMDLLQRPLLKHLPADQQFLFFTGIADKFMVYLQVSIVMAVFLTVPFHLYLIWKFIRPALYERERKFAAPFLMLGTFSFLVGLAFGYFAVIPMGYDFLISFGSEGGLANTLRPMITITQYIPLTLKILAVVGGVFELPVVLMILGALGIVRPQMLRQFRRYAYMGLFVLAAVLTPTPDAFSMIVVAIPLCLLYELAIWGVQFVQRFREEAPEAK